MFTKYSVISILLLLMGCSLFENEQSIPADLTGQWEWVRTSGGFAGTVTYSDSVDYSQSLRIFKYNQAIWYRNGEVEQRYQIDRVKEDGVEKFVMHPQIKENGSFQLDRTLSGIINGELQVQDECTDCYQYSFKK